MVYLKEGLQDETKLYNMFDVFTILCRSTHAQYNDQSQSRQARPIAAVHLLSCCNLSKLKGILVLRSI